MKKILKKQLKKKQKKHKKWGSVSLIQIEDKIILETFLKWVRTLGEIIQWMISAIQEVPWLIKDTKGVRG